MTDQIVLTADGLMASKLKKITKNNKKRETPSPAHIHTFLLQREAANGQLDRLPFRWYPNNNF